MDREKQIEEAATSWCFSDHEENHDSDSRSFIKGAQWADGNPDWTPCMSEIKLDDYIHDHRIMKEAILLALGKYDGEDCMSLDGALLKLKVRND